MARQQCRNQQAMALTPSVRWPDPMASASPAACEGELAWPNRERRHRLGALQELVAETPRAWLETLTGVWPALT